MYVVYVCMYSPHHIFVRIWVQARKSNKGGKPEHHYIYLLAYRSVQAPDPVFRGESVRESPPYVPPVSILYVHMYVCSIPICWLRSPLNFSQAVDATICQLNVSLVLFPGISALHPLNLLLHSLAQFRLAILRARRMFCWTWKLGKSWTWRNRQTFQGTPPLTHLNLFLREKRK
jgi:hypothetical protein